MELAQQLLHQAKDDLELVQNLRPFSKRAQEHGLPQELDSQKPLIIPKRLLCTHHFRDHVQWQRGGDRLQKWLGVWFLRSLRAENEDTWENLSCWRAGFEKKVLKLLFYYLMSIELSRDALEYIKTYRYKTNGLTPLEIYVFDPFWTFIANNLLPDSLAPNALTIMGLIVPIC